MPGTLVEKAICESCGSEVRDRSAFCFNCGESVVVEPPPPPIGKPATGTLNGKNASTLAFSEMEPAPVLMPEGDLPIATEAPNAEKTSVPITRPRRTRLVKKTLSPVEVEWVENTGSSIGYIVGSVIFALVAIGLLVLAMYLR
ncbi:MAG: zinc ribbon domain-containing protein [Acidobacteria bacterium]|nr:zinc ribbon domain-containing protein [Acidobacteriota bacterium]